MKYLVTLLNGVVSVHDFSMTVSPVKSLVDRILGGMKIYSPMVTKNSALMRLAQLFRGKVNVYKTSPAVSHILSI